MCGANPRDLADRAGERKASPAQDIHSISEERLAPLMPSTAISNNHDLLSQDHWVTLGPHVAVGTILEHWNCVIATPPGPTGLAAIEGEGARPALLFSGDNRPNPDAPQALPSCSHHHGGDEC